MAKNNVKSVYMKSEDVVFLGNKDIETKSSAPATTPRQRLSRPVVASSTPCANEPLITRTEIKYQTIQPKVTSETAALRTPTATQRSVQVIHQMNTLPMVAVTALCNVTTNNTECKNPDFSPALNQQQQDLVTRRKHHLNRPSLGLKRSPRQRISLSPTHISYSQKEEVKSSNGQSCSNRAPSIKSTCFGSGVTITPIAGSKTIQKTNNVVTSKLPPAKAGDLIFCSSCSAQTKYTDKCEHCHQAFIGAPVHSFNKSTEQKSNSKDTVTQTPPTNAAIVNSTLFSKEAFYGSKVQEPQTTQCIRQVSGSKVIVREIVNPTGTGTRGRPKGSRNRVPEPECLTISSDDDEPMDVMSNRRCVNEYSSSNNSPLLRQQPPRAVANISQQQRLQVQRHFMSARGQDREGKKYGETDDQDDESNKILKPLPDEEELEDEEEMMDEDSDLKYNSEELNRSLEGNEKEPVEVVNAQGQKIIQCRSIRIGSFKIHPKHPSNYVPVIIGNNSYSFQGPTLKSCTDTATLTLEEKDICSIFAHLGRCLPIMFIVVKPTCAERIRKQIGMIKNETVYFDPELEDPKQKYITLLIEVISDELRNVVRGMSPNIFQEIDQKSANEILVKSTPNHQSPTPQVSSVLIQAIPKNINVSPPSQVTKILTYPPPPQSGGIEITSDDLACLNDGEFLNDAIIDFYLKYLMHEKLSEEDRARTHIFNSFFYPRLTQKPITRGKNEDGSSISVKRHTQVRSWTKNVDIFAKDFIIIPINQNIHWFLAIICNPGQVPETPPSVPGKSVSSQKSAAENVTSSNDQESCSSPAASCSSSPSEIESGRGIVTTKDQACSTEDASSDESSVYNNCYTNEAESSFTEDDANDAPDSTTNPDRSIPNTKSPCILIFDSLPGPSRNRIIHTLREYLEIEWRNRKNSHRAFNKVTMQGYSPNVPLQSNFSDCGIYVLQYVESFFENPLPYYANTIPELEEWFSTEKIYNKRKEIKDLILELEKRPLPASSVISSSTSERGNSKQNVENKVASSSVQKS